MTNKTQKPKLTAIYADAEEKYVKNVVLYSNAAGEVFYDEALTQTVPATELQNLYLKGLVVFNTETQQYLTPTQFTVNGEEGTIDFGAPAGSGSGESSGSSSGGSSAKTKIYMMTDVGEDGYSYGYPSLVAEVNSDGSVGHTTVYIAGNYNVAASLRNDFFDPNIKCFLIDDFTIDTSSSFESIKETLTNKIQNCDLHKVVDVVYKLTSSADSYIVPTYINTSVSVASGSASAGVTKSSEIVCKFYIMNRNDGASPKDELLYED